MIWLLCLPSRVSELDLPHEARCLVCDLWEAEPLCWRSSRKVTGANRAGSLTVHECRESRDVALETGGPQDALKRARAPGRLRLCGRHGDASRVTGRTARHRAHELAPRGRHLVDYARPGRSPALLGVVGGQDAVGAAAIDHAGLSAVLPWRRPRPAPCVVPLDTVSAGRDNAGQGRVAGRHGPACCGACRRYENCSWAVWASGTYMQQVII